MTAAGTSKWTAFLLSACVPGAGQLAARSWTAALWFAAAGGLAAGVSQIGNLPLQLLAGFTLCLLSAEHAKRLLEKRCASGRSTSVSSSVCRGTYRGRYLNIGFSLDVARSREELWELISDFPRFLTMDPFHDEVTLMRERPAAGVDLVLSHNAFGRRFLRFGKILAWNEGSGYTFSDLSPRGAKRGFPHVFVIGLAPLEHPGGQHPGGQSPLTRLTVEVRGRWTSRLVPVWLGRVWIWLVCHEHARLLRKGI